MANHRKKATMHLIPHAPCISPQGHPDPPIPSSRTHQHYHHDPAIAGRTPAKTIRKPCRYHAQTFSSHTVPKPTLQTDHHSRHDPPGPIQPASCVPFPRPYTPYRKSLCIGKRFSHSALHVWSSLLHRNLPRDPKHHIKSQTPCA